MDLLLVISTSLGRSEREVSNSVPRVSLTCNAPQYCEYSLHLSRVKIIATRTSDANCKGFEAWVRCFTATCFFIPSAEGKGNQLGALRMNPVQGLALINVARKGIRQDSLNRNISVAMATFRY